MEHYFTRRKWFKEIVLLGISLWFLFKFFSFRPKKKSLIIKVKKNKIPENGALVLRNKEVAIIKKNKIIYALSLKCTHLGCTVTVTPSGIRCPCHGSVFNIKGTPIKGPASKPLKRFPIRLKNNEIWILKR